MLIVVAAIIESAGVFHNTKHGAGLFASRLLRKNGGKSEFMPYMVPV
jgi:hypothetical protein